MSQQFRYMSTYEKVGRIVAWPFQVIGIIIAIALMIAAYVPVVLVSFALCLYYGPRQPADERRSVGEYLVSSLAFPFHMLQFVLWAGSGGSILDSAPRIPVIGVVLDWVNTWENKHFSRKRRARRQSNPL
jgi:hypothetical protein